MHGFGCSGRDLAFGHGCDYDHDCCDFVCNCDAGLGHDFGCYDTDTDLDHDHDYATTALLRPRLGRGLRPRLRLGLTTFCWFLLSSPHEHSNAKNDKNYD